MPLILAIEPDRKQAAQLAGVVRKRVKAELILVETTERALDAIGNRMPDLVLVPALLSPQDDAALAAALRVIAAAAHVQMLTIPVLASPRPTSRAGGMLSSLRRGKAQVATPEGCDPSVFADQIASYLEAASQERPAHVAVIDTVPAPSASDAVHGASAPPAFDAIRQDFDEALAQDPAPQTQPQDQMQAAAYEEPAPVAADESVSLALEEAVLALFADPAEHVPAVPSLDVEAAPEAPAVAQRPAAPSYEPQAAPYAETQHHEPVTRHHDVRAVRDVHDVRAAREAEVAAVDIPVVPVAETAAPAFDIGVGDLDVASTTLEVEAPVFEAVAPMMEVAAPADVVESAVPDAVQAVDDVTIAAQAPVVETAEAPAVATATAAAVEEWAAVDELMAALQAMPLPALEMTSVDEWIAPAAAARVERQPEQTAQEQRNAGDAAAGAKDKAGAASPAKSEREWVALIESLRSDVERLRTERSEKPARKETPAAPPRVIRAVKTPKPIQDEWGFFDPQQCGFAALLAKLDEVTDSDESSPRAVNQ